MGEVLNGSGQARLERSCGPSPRDWLRLAPSQPGIDRIEAYFAGHAYDPHRHDTYAIGYTLDGAQAFDYRGAPTVSVSGNAIVLHPDVTHDGRAATQTGFRYRMIYVEPRLIRDALGPRARSLPFVRDAVSADPRLMAALRPALDHLDRCWEALERDHVILGIADALLARDPGARGRTEPSTCTVAVERAREFLAQHFRRAVASQELEAITGLDRYALARQFRARLGTSPYRYLTMRRLDHARAAMRAGRTLAEAALASGFADQSHMTRQFKQAYGLPPGRWRAIRVADGRRR
ncbi:MAG: AraC family transcriptional regulator [Alphaproteobacteria bacterium]|nr:AraC family transcriptional regulator [Alphaproteobacteria bacterium]